MNILKLVGLTMAAALLAATQIAHAGSWVCEYSDFVREIKVERPSGAPAPCSVVYNKDSEGQGSSVLWSAENDGPYCDAKADGLAEKLKGYGWTCAKI